MRGGYQRNTVKFNKYKYRNQYLDIFLKKNVLIHNNIIRHSKSKFLLPNPCKEPNKYIC